MTAWRLDDWMRPVRGGRYGGSRRPVTGRDRRWMVATLVTCAVLVAGTVAVAGPGRGLSWTGGLIGVSLVQAVSLYRSREVGWP